MDASAWRRTTPPSCSRLVEQHGMQATRIEVTGSNADTERRPEPRRERRPEVSLFEQIFGGISLR